MTGFDSDLRQQVFGPASLMGGNHVLEAEDFLHGFFQMLEIATSGVSFIAQHHCRPLVIAHGVGAAVGQKVDINIFRIDQESVVASRCNHFFTLFARNHPHCFNSFYAERFRRVLV